MREFFLILLSSWYVGLSFTLISILQTARTVAPLTARAPLVVEDRVAVRTLTH